MRRAIVVVGLLVALVRPSVAELYPADLDAMEQELTDINGALLDWLYPAYLNSTDIRNNTEDTVTWVQGVYNQLRKGNTPIVDYTSRIADTLDDLYALTEESVTDDGEWRVFRGYDPVGLSGPAANSVFLDYTRTGVVDGNITASSVFREDSGLSVFVDDDGYAWLRRLGTMESNSTAQLAATQAVYGALTQEVGDMDTVEARSAGSLAGVNWSFPNLSSWASKSSQAKVHTVAAKSSGNLRFPDFTWALSTDPYSFVDTSFLPTWTAVQAMCKLASEVVWGLAFVYTVKRHVEAAS